MGLCKTKIEEVNSSEKLEDLIKSLLNPINFIDNEENYLQLLRVLISIWILMAIRF